MNHPDGDLAASEAIDADRVEADEVLAQEVKSGE
jgi:hypothetical protein